jgi:hypothetical protein
MSSIEDRIINMLKGNKNPDNDILEKIKLTLLWDTDQNIPLNFIRDVAKNG